jgi:hypothetical protein
MKPFTALLVSLVTVLIAAPAASAQSGGLVAAYGFEETSDTSAIDSSGAGNTGTLAVPAGQRPDASAPRCRSTASTIA